MIRPAPVAAWLLLSLCAAGLFAEEKGEKPTDAVSTDPSHAEAVDYHRDIQPVLAKRCYSCHGAEQAEGSLRLDRKDEALRGGNSGVAIVPGKSAESRLVTYVAATSDDDMVMPPEGERLSETEVAMIRRWVDQGVPWPEEKLERRTTYHWAFKPIKAVKPPKLSRKQRVHNDAVHNDIDRFILAKLAEHRLQPSPEADRATLVRRLSLDLLGLPPSPADVDEFVNDTSPDAYAHMVDRILASSHFGERWARHWLDLARYADSDGYEKDTGRPFAWRYRQWVIDALNADMPFDAFTIKQLAGDLLPDATLEDRVATGFHRNTLTNKEGGVDQEEFRVAATIDRVNTTGSVWLGLTVGCAQCHTHKYDPILQREYYGLFAFFNSVQERDIPAPLAKHLDEYSIAKAAFDADHAPLVAAVKTFEKKQLPAKLAAWEGQLQLPQQTTWTPLEPKSLKALQARNVKIEHVGEGIVSVTGDNPELNVYTVTGRPEVKQVTAVRLEVLLDPALKGHGPGRAHNGNFVLTEIRIQKITPGKTDADKPKTTPVTIRFGWADVEQKGYPLKAAFDGDMKESGWGILPGVGKSHVAVFELATPVTLAPGEQLSIVLDQQYRSQHTLSRFRLSVTGDATPVQAEGSGVSVPDVLAKSDKERTTAERNLLLSYYRGLDAELVKLDKAVADHLKKAPADPNDAFKAQTLAEMGTPRETHILVRGDFLRPGASVEPHTLEVLPPLTVRGAKPDRLDLAAWLVDPKNPLTARVTVNRVWSQLFGRGLVASVADFGTQGDKPSHAELLDWLAADFQRDWSFKGLVRRIVMSATYRQSSKYRQDLHEVDPLNVLLARQRRMRVEAEVVRDLALAASGLMVDEIGGPSVRPRQPESIAKLTYAGGSKWVDSTGPDRFRRGLYTWFQRTSPYPMLMTFDAPDSNVACTRRERSNTPLQALTLLNDPAFFECAQALGKRIVKESPADRDARLSYAMRLCVGREPDAEELDTLGALFDEQLQLMQGDSAAAREVVGSAKPTDGRPRASGGTSEAELAAWIMVGRTLLNLDEFITRE